MKRIGVLISGRGSNMQALCKAAKSSSEYEVAVVLSNQSNAAGIQWAKEEGLSTSIVPHEQFKSKAAFEAALEAELNEADIDLICLAGFMRLLSASFVAQWPGAILNIHPSLLPAFPGLHPQRQALEAGVLLSGCTVHFVSAEMDAGPIIAQAAVPVKVDDDETALSERILASEHKLYAQALEMVCRGAVNWDGKSAQPVRHENLVIGLN